MRGRGASLVEMVAEAVASGVSVDWVRLDAVVSDARDRRLLQQLKVLATLADFHRRPVTSRRVLPTSRPGSAPA